MVKIYISSTFEDLKEYREAVVQLLKKGGGREILAMEDYLAKDQRPLEKCLDDVAASDVYIGIFAWRYGFIPKQNNPDQKSITELEYRKAKEVAGKAYTFLVKEDVPWPRHFQDDVTREGDSGARIAAFKSELRENSVVNYFSNKAELAGLVTAVVAGWEKKHHAYPEGNAQHGYPSPLTGAIRIVIPSQDTPPNVTLKLTPAQVSGGVVIEFVAEGVRQAEAVVPASHSPPETIEVAEDDILALEYVDGTEQFLTANEMREELASSALVDRAPAASGGAGFGGNILKSLQVLSIDDAYFDGSGKVPRERVLELEHRLRPSPGIFQFADPDKMGDPVDPSAFTKNNGPLLLFMHGPGMRNADTYRDLRNHAVWGTISDTYGDRLLAYEHHTISVSPIANALQIARWVPPESTLHMITHSRAGLVAELLCLPQDGVEASEAIISPLQGALKAENDNARYHALENDIEDLRELLSLRARKRWRVARFLRIACPAKGITTNRLDHYLSLLLNLSTKSKNTHSDGLLKVLTLTVVKHRISFFDLPGLAAQLPSSPLIRILNNPRWESESDLNVVGGRCSSADMMLPVLFAADNLYAEAGDGLVAHSSTKGGLRRRNAVREWYEGRNCSHFGYFENDLVCQHIGEWLTGDDWTLGSKNPVSR
ncbi:MAG: DUF4062 domain-containing protein [Gammaproteobacteria bacterium]|nr:DUF4062 domain-containing protein [Gammaproteobacteria bacterium]